ncbi:unnamed protein product, partial [Phaeothamnion confervicola]
FSEAGGAAYARLWIKDGPYGTPTSVPSSWLSTRLNTLPPGWSLAVGPGGTAFVRAFVDGDTLSLIGPDGASTDWTRPPGSSSKQGWKPETGTDGFASQGVDGSVVANYDGWTYTFNLDGSLREVNTAVDDQNRSSSARYTYDGSGRPTLVYDPVTTVSPLTSGRQLRFVYAGDPACTSSSIPTGYLCAIQFAKSNTDGSPETWTKINYSTNTSAATITSIVNYPDSLNPTALDRNQTWTFGFAGSSMLQVWDPRANDAIKAGVRGDSVAAGDTSASSWYLQTTQVDWYWHAVTAIYAPAPSVGAARPGQTYTRTIYFDANHYGFTQRDLNLIGFTPPPSGYVSRTHLDAKARVDLDYNAYGVATTTTYNINNDQVETQIDNLQRKFKTYYDSSGNIVEQWGPVPSASTTCWADLVARTDPTTPFPSNCNSVPVVETDYDLDVNAVPKAEYPGLNAVWWANTNLAPSGSETRPALVTLGIGGSGGAVDKTWLAPSGPTGLKSSTGAAVVDNFSVELTGVIVFPSTGSYTMTLFGNDKASMWIDNTQIGGETNSNTTSGSFNATAGVRYRIRITLIENTGDAAVTLYWTPPSSSQVVVPGTALHPDYNFPTQTTTYTSNTATDVSTATLPTPAYGQVGTIADDGLSTAYTYETPGSGWGRALTRTLPAGNSWSFTYYGDVATLTSTVCGVATTVVQSGLLRKRTGPDPDGGTPDKRRIEEFVYDIYGHQRGSRSGIESGSTGELAPATPWSCVDSVDYMQRPTSVTVPGFGAYSARTTLFDYAKNGNPLIAELCDNNVTGSPNASSDTCNGKNGVITTSIDLLGRTISYIDVWGKTYTTSIDQAGRITSRTSPAGTENFGFDAQGQPTTHQLGATTLATATYNSTSGELKSVTYANGTSLADLDATGRRWDDRSIKELTFNGPGGTITSNQLTGRDRTDRITSETIDGNEYRYSFDNYDRLSRAQFGPTGFFTPNHDWQYCYQDQAGSGGAAPSCTSGDVNAAGANGNRVSSYDNGTKLSGLTYDSADRLIGVSLLTPFAGNTISYDDHGNTTLIAGESLGYDGADRHTVTSNGSSVVTYLRDATDRIVGRTGNDGTTRYTFSAFGDSPSAVLDGSNNLVQTTISLVGGVIVTVQTSGNVWSYPNLQGSIAAVANNSGAKQGSTYFYDPFGNSVSPAAIPDNSQGNLDYGWMGQNQRPVEHNSGLRQQTEMGARGYDAQIGRFLEVDPVLGGAPNDYAYGGDPRNGADLDGRDFKPYW